MRLTPLVPGLLAVLVCRPAVAAQKTVTLFLDGARVEQQLAAPGGYLEVELPQGFAAGSLRVKAPGGGSVLRVELVAADRDRRRAAEIARLKERRGELQDRMAALKRREEIFSAAVKSQSGKTPRKTKANPDPVRSLQQGTEFALGQMEAVYRSRRKCQKALEEVERELERSTKGVASARIWIAGAKASIGYLVEGERWTPSYDLRFGEGSAELVLHAKLPQRAKGVQYRVSSGTVAQDAAAVAVGGDYPVLSRHKLVPAAGSGTGSNASRFAFAAVEPGLPSGEAAVFWRGEYLGTGPFAGGGATEVVIGR